MSDELRDVVEAWIALDPSETDRATLRRLLDDGENDELRRRFAAPLTFGTAGLRGPVMAGPAGMNQLTVRRATQGVVAWLHDLDLDVSRGVVVGRDGRHGSELFNDEVVAVLLGAGVTVYEMPRALPTPLVPFAVRSLGACAGVMVTASHNPPQDNGYKLYGPDGIQIIAPNDAMVEAHARAAGPAALGRRGDAHHHVIDEALLARYRDLMATRFAAPGPIDWSLTYTPLHGVGGATMCQLFAAAGYDAVHVVPAQFATDAGFPTLAFPNPEEPGALDLAIEEAERHGSRLIIANDPDADRLGAAERTATGWHVFRGDEIGWLLGASLLRGAGADDVVATTIVSSTMLERMAREAGVRFALTLTGFKWIARAAGDGHLRFGYEEALGFCVDEHVGDKDGLSAALALCQLAATRYASGSSLVAALDELETRFGVHRIDQLSLRASGPQGVADIKAAVARVRATPPTHLAGLAVSEHVDLNEGFRGLGPTDGLWLTLGDAGRVVIRPSGTEAKLKVYVELTPNGPGDLAARRAHADQLLARLRDELRALLAF